MSGTEPTNGDSNAKSGKPRKHKRVRNRRRTDGERKPRSLGGFFLRGLMTLLPVVLTVVVFGLLFQMIDRYVTGPINDAIYWSLERNAIGWKALDELGIDPYAGKYINEDLLPSEIRTDALQLGINSEFVQSSIENHREQNETFLRDLELLGIDPRRLRSDVAKEVHPVYGIFISLLVVLWLGWLVGSFVGRRLVANLDRAMHMIPVVKSVYPYSKQLVEFFFAEKNLEFDTVVTIPYPSPGLWSIAFVTGQSLRTLRAETGKDMITCFVPSSPMPMTGYTIFVEAHRVIPIPISVDEALRITMTGGVLVPPREAVEDVEVEVEGIEPVSSLIDTPNE